MHIFSVLFLFWWREFLRFFSHGFDLIFSALLIDWFWCGLEIGNRHHIHHTIRLGCFWCWFFRLFFEISMSNDELFCISFSFFFSRRINFMPFTVWMLLCFFVYVVFHLTICSNTFLRPEKKSWEMSVNKSHKTL